MSAHQFIGGLVDSPLVVALLTAVLSSFLGSYFGLRSYIRQSKELVDGAITWQWTHGYDGSQDEEPYLAIQNRSPVPAFIVRARYLRGIFVRTEARKYAFDYGEPREGYFPLEVKAQGVTSFPLSTHTADGIAGKANWLSMGLGYVLKRSYLWVEITTISGHRMLIASNDATSFRDRPLWLEGRWLPTPKPDWMKTPEKPASRKAVSPQPSPTASS